MSANEDILQQPSTESVFRKDASPQVEDSSHYEDGDSCSPEEINKLFKHKYKIHDELSVTYESDYVLNLAKDDSFTYVASGLSNGSVRLFDINSEKGIYIESPDINHSVCGLRFLDETSNLLLVGTTNGLVRFIDLRGKADVLRFINNPEDNRDPKNILCFDRNSSSRLLVMGTEQKRDNVYLLFYDLRTSKKLFTYMESHQDDISCVSFHPQIPELLCSGSTDGLINIFNIRNFDDTENILTTINTESTIEKLHWHKDQEEKNIVSCITHTNHFKTYTFDGDLIADFERLKISEAIQLKNEYNCNLINSHSLADNTILVVAGSTFNNGSILRSCRLENGQLLPYANFGGNSQRVRESIFDPKTNILITGGEGGVVTLWTPLNWDSANHSTSSSNFKMKDKKSNKVTPY